MAADLNGKNILFLALPAALDHALREQLHGAAIRNDSDSDGHTDLIVCAGGHAETHPGIPRVRVPAQARLGQVLAALRRALDEPALAVLPFALGGDTFYPAEKKLERHGQPDIALTERETTLLLYLARHAPRAVTREALLRDVWRYQDGIDTHTLETHIYRLRQKIERDAAAPAVLVTVAEGYRLDAIAPAGDDL